MLHGNNKQINISGKQWLENTFDSNSWVILSPVEQSIRAKIEKYGTPLRDWDIKINRGVLTGCNEAFIITTAKREEILANCKTKDERKRTDEIIRPILRGRDIKRYKYDWKGLWLINTHNGVKGRFPRIDIKDYPAIKQWLDKGGEAYNGKIYHGYKDIEKRADKGDTPYNLRNCAYLEDFSKPKIIWKRVGSIIRFCYTEKSFFALDSTCFAIGKYVKFLTFVLNSPLGHFLLKDSPKTGTGDLLISVQAIAPLRIPLPKDFNVLEQDSINEESEFFWMNYTYKKYHLTVEERNYINKLYK